MSLIPQVARHALWHMASLAHDKDAALVFNIDGTIDVKLQQPEDKGEWPRVFTKKYEREMLEHLRQLGAPYLLVCDTRYFKLDSTLNNKRKTR